MKQNSRNNEKVISINISDESSNESQSNESKNKSQNCIQENKLTVVLVSNHLNVIIRNAIRITKHLFI
jgi:hypothetical protein